MKKSLLAVATLGLAMVASASVIGSTEHEHAPPMTQNDIDTKSTFTYDDTAILRVTRSSPSRCEATRYHEALTLTVPATHITVSGHTVPVRATVSRRLTAEGGMFA